MAIKRSDDIVGDAKKIVRTIRRRQKIKSLIPVFTATFIIGAIAIIILSPRPQNSVETQPLISYAAEQKKEEEFRNTPIQDTRMSDFVSDSEYFSSFAYTEDFLNPEEQKVYEEVYSCIVWASPSITVSTKDPEILKKAVTCVLIDHPEIFFMEDYKFSKYTVDGEIRKLTFSPSYSMDVDEIVIKWNALSESIDEIVQQVPMETSDYDKVAMLYDFIIDNTVYDIDAADNQNIISVFFNGASVCQGYAKSMQLLLLRLKMPATLITGKIIGGELHAWNAVKVDGDWCYVDVTWGDAAYVFDRGEGHEERVHESNYDYLLVPYDDISSTHRADFPVELPECITAAHSYYTKEGYYVDNFDKKTIDAVVSKQVNLPYVIVKCVNEDIYKQTLYYLVDDYGIQKSFPNKKISYSANDPMRKLTFRVEDSQ